MAKPDTISVTVVHRDEVEADKADIHVTIKGSSLATGTAALKKASEVNQLVTALAEVGIEEQDVALKSIRAESSSGILAKSTSATYQLRIRCNDLEGLADILGVVTSQKNGKLDFLAWRYPDDKKLKEEWLQSCLGEAQKKASTIASRLGVKLLGVHTLAEKWVESKQTDRPFLNESRGAGMMIRELTRSAPIELGFPLSNSKWVELQLEIQFRVSELKAQ